MNGFDIFGGIVDAAKIGYNLYTNKRDFDYQQALQQQIFQREDTAIQRRMADLKAAGINPNIAAGSAAGAGAVVSRSNTNDLGSALDTVQAINSIRQQRQQVENAKVENEILQNQRNKTNVENSLQRAELFNMLGLPYSIEVSRGKNNELELNFGVDWSGEQGKTWNYKEDMPLYHMFDYNLKNQRNSADYLQKELNWYTANQVTNLVTSLLPNIGFNFGKRFK